MAKNIVTLGGVGIPTLALVKRTQNRAWRFEEQRTVSDKTVMQHSGKEPTTEDWELSLLASFCDPEKIKGDLEAKMDVKKPEPMPMVWADGTMTGMFVMEKLSSSYEQKDGEGKVIHSKITLTLKQADAVAPKPTPLQSSAPPLKMGAGGDIVSQALQQLGNMALGAAESFAQQQFRNLVGDQVANRIPAVAAAMQTVQGVFRTPNFVP
jgi:phage protein U